MPEYKEKRYGIKDIYKKYKKNGGKLSKGLYNKVCGDFNSMIMDIAIKKGYEIRLPYRLGFLRVMMSKPRMKVKDGVIQKITIPIDWGETRKMWRDEYPGKTMSEIKEIKNKRLVYHSNNDTNGNVLRWYWDKRISTFRNRNIMMFRPARGMVDNNGIHYGNRGISAWVKNKQNYNKLIYYMKDGIY